MTPLFGLSRDIKELIKIVRPNRKKDYYLKPYIAEELFYEIIMNDLANDIEWN